MKHLSILLVLFFFSNFRLLATKTDSIDSLPAVKFEASYMGDFFTNFSGGLKTGSTYLGLLNLKAAIDFEKAGFWKNGLLQINLANTHGGRPTENFVGDFQGVSNIEAENLTYMYELWYQHTLGKFSLKLGLQDLNVDLAVSETASIFSNGSFGIHSCITDNVACAVFPLTALGLDAHWQISKNLQWHTAIFDGTPDNFENNPYNLKWKMSKNDGFLAFSELQLRKSLIKNMDGNYKLGIYYHQHQNKNIPEKRNGGIYFVGDQQINDKTSIFSQIALSPKSLNKNNRYYSIGLTHKGLIKNRDNDQIGIALAHAGMTDTVLGSETVLECTYQIQLSQQFYLRPDFQYIINPAGTDSNPDNAFVGFLRFGLNF